MLNVAVLGCGKIAQVHHIPEYAANENCTLVGFFNPKTSRAEDMAAKYGGKVTADEIGLPVTQTGAVLPCGSSARWQA